MTVPQISLGFRNYLEGKMLPICKTITERTYVIGVVMFGDAQIQSAINNYLQNEQVQNLPIWLDDAKTDIDPVIAKDFLSKLLTSYGEGFEYEGFEVAGVTLFEKIKPKVTDIDELFTYIGV